jgi:HSP20 family protein
MGTGRYEPWSLLGQLSNELNRIYEGQPQGAEQGDGSSMITSDWVPAVDILEAPDSYVIYADVPGVHPDAVEINMDNGILSIQGARREERAGEELRRAERAQGRFHRRFSLPDTADAERISASCRHGVLEIVIPKQAKVKPRRIRVEG